MKTVYLLGSGVNREDYPMVSLGENLLEPMITGDKHENLRTFISDFFSITKTKSERKSELPSMNDVLNLLDLAIQEQRPLTNKYNLLESQKIRYDLIYLISEQLHHQLQPENRSTEPVIGAFIKKIRMRALAIISFNYDLLVDNAIRRCNASVNYGFKVRGHIEPGRKELLRRQFEQMNNNYNRTDSMLLYKPHGSLNWLYCPTCDAIDVTEGMKAVYYLYLFEAGKHVRQCSVCSTSYEPLIIMPTMIKNYNNRFLREIWHHAEEAIKEANQLVFIGIALAPDDYYIRYIVNRALAVNQNRKNGSLKVEVVSKSGNKESDTYKQYKRFFGKSVTLYPGSFRKYVNDM
jgi:hypothetical protein